jgi:hypothetical protein
MVTRCRKRALLLLSLLALPLLLAVLLLPPLPLLLLVRLLPVTIATPSAGPNPSLSRMAGVMRER